MAQTQHSFQTLCPKKITSLTHMLCFATIVQTPVGYLRPFWDRVVLFNNLVTFLQEQVRCWYYKSITLY